MGYIKVFVRWRKRRGCSNHFFFETDELKMEYQNTYKKWLDPSAGVKAKNLILCHNILKVRRLNLILHDFF